MNLITKAFESITFQDVVDVCVSGTVESAVLDYKAVIPKDLSKHFAIFSNSQGGLIVIGVEEDEDTGIPKKYDGLEYNAKMIDRIHQFAANVSPFPRYAVRATNEFEGKVFILVKIFPGDVPPYMSNSDSSIKIRTGNVSTPIKSVDSHELNRLYDRRLTAVNHRLQQTAFSHSVYDMSLRHANLSTVNTTGTIDDSSQAREEVEFDIANFRVSIMPISPSEPVINYKFLRSKLTHYSSGNYIAGEFPSRQNDTLPGGIVFSDSLSAVGGFRFGMVNEYGLIDSVEDVMNSSVNPQRRDIYSNHIIAILIRQFNVAAAFYNLSGYNGQIVVNISLDGAAGVNIHHAYPSGRYPIGSSRPSHRVDRVARYTWDIEDLDTVKINDTSIMVDRVVKFVQRMYWDFGIGTVPNDSILAVLGEFGWSRVDNSSDDADS
ncbi:MAG: ATP-binding protein [Chloroflexi bacterium]|nr:MAG: ATP-binding protein [Chloroflexota bacterium]